MTSVLPWLQAEFSTAVRRNLPAERGGEERERKEREGERRKGKGGGKMQHTKIHEQFVKMLVGIGTGTYVYP